MYRFCRLPLTFDTARLRSDLDALAAADWVAHYVPSNYDGDWSIIALRCVAGRVGHPDTDPGAPPEAYHDTPALSTCRYLREVLAQFRCPVQAARLMKLAAGSRIKEHVDHDLGASSGWARLHIPLVTHPHVEFYVEDERVFMGEGECWYIDASLPHRLYNPGPVDRVHLVFDCLVNDWLQGQLRTGGYVAPVPSYFEARGVAKQDVDKVVEALQAMGSEVGARLAADLERNRS